MNSASPNEAPHAVPAPRVTVRDDALRPRQRRIALLTIVGPSLGFALAISVAAARGFSGMDLGMLLTGLLLSEIAIEVGFHRLLAHKSYETYAWLRTLAAIGGSMTGQGRVIHWVANHRRHHIHSDTPHDPHSPYLRTHPVTGASEELGFWRGLVHAQWGHMLTDGVPNGTLFARDLLLDKSLRRVNEHYSALLWLGLALPGLIGFALTGTFWGAASGVLWGGLARMFLVQNVTWAVASASHRFGYAPFDAGDRSKNLIWTALPSFGSGYQNNHHAFPNSAFLGLRWWEIDFGAIVLRALSAAGLVWNLKRPSPRQLEMKRLPQQT